LSWQPGLSYMFSFHGPLSVSAALLLLSLFYCHDLLGQINDDDDDDDDDACQNVTAKAFSSVPDSFISHNKNQI